MTQLKICITCLIFTTLALSAPKPKYIAYSNHPWPDSHLNIRIHWTDGNETKIFREYVDGKGVKIGEHYHKEYYTNSIDCRGGRIAYIRRVQVRNEKTYSYSYKKVVVTDLGGALIREFGKALDPNMTTNCYSARLSPDGAYVAFSISTEVDDDEIKSRMRLAEIATGAVMDVTPDILGAWSWSPTWSPCGRYLAFFHKPGLKKQRMLVAYEIATGTTRKLATVEDPGWATVWSADGQSIVMEYERDDGYNRGAAEGSKVRLSRLDLITRKVSHVLDCTTDWTRCLAGSLPDGRLMFRSIDPAIAHRRYYSTGWNVLLDLPPQKHYLMDAKTLKSIELTDFELDRPHDYIIEPVSGRAGVAPDLSQYPELRPSLPALLELRKFRIGTSVSVEKDVVRLHAVIPPGMSAESVWWEDSSGRFYNGTEVTVNKEAFDQAGGMFLRAVFQDGTLYEQFVKNSHGAPPVKAPSSKEHDFTAVVEPTELGKRVLINGIIPMELRPIPAGSIVTDGVYHREEGRTYSDVCFLYDEGYANPRAMIERHEIKVEPFFIGVYEVTQAQFKAVMGYERSTFKGPDLPVENVRGLEAEKFCKKLSEKTGLTFRLPRLTEWKYAANGNTGTRYYWGDTLDPKHCNYAGKWAAGLVMTEDDWNAAKETVSTGRTVPVGSYGPNPFGLFDIYGNVAEMCRARNGERMIRGKKVEWDLERSGPFSRGQDSRVRYASMGGGWVHYGEMVDNHRWFSDCYGYKRDWNGFRVVVDIPKD